MVFSTTMKLLLVILVLAISTALTDDNVQAEEVAKNQSVQNVTNQEDAKADEASAAKDEAVTFEKFKNEMITYQDAEKMVESGKHFMVAVVAEPGKMSLEYLKKLPDLNKGLEEYDKNFKIYAMDARDPKNSELIKQRVKVVPATILFLGDMNGIIYNEERTAPTVWQFYRRALETTITKIETAKALSTFDHLAYATVLFVIEDESKETADILVLARRFLDAKFGYIIKGSDIAKDFPCYLYIHRTGERRVPLEEKKTRNEVEDFIRVHTHQPVFNFPVETYSLSWLDENLYLFYAHNPKGLMESSAWMQNIGNKQRGKFVMLLCDVDNPNVNYAMDFLSLKREGLPYVRLFVKSTNSVYKMEDSFDGEINEESVTAFMNAFEEGKLKSTVKSQELPDNWNATSLKTLVGNNFAEVVQNKTMNVLVLFHTAETSYTIPVFEKIAELYKDVINILVAKMDADHNGIAPPYKPAEMIPSVRLYEETTNIERIYEKDEITEEGIRTFIEQTTGIVAKREEVQQAKPKPIISDLGSEPEKHVEL